LEEQRSSALTLGRLGNRTHTAQVASVLRSRRSAVPGDNVPLAIRRLKMIREEVTTTTTTMMMMWWGQHMPEGLIRGRLG
jgi:hypothetical protein